MNSNYENLFKDIILNEKDAKFNIDTLKDDLDNFLLVLNDKEIFVIRSLYGLDCDKKTAEKIADILNIKTSSVVETGEMCLRKFKLLYGLNNRNFTIDVVELRKIASELCNIQQGYDRYYESERGNKESNVTKFYKRVINLCDVVESRKEDNESNNKSKKGKIRILENN